MRLMREAKEDVTIYVKLLNEVVDVWRPVIAVAIRGDIYQIRPEQNYPREIEVWPFNPGMYVRCEQRTFQNGEVGLEAVEQVAPFI